VTIPLYSDPTVVELIVHLQQQRESKVRELEYAQLKISWVEEKLRQHLIAKYGEASEKLSDLQLELLELEPGVSSEEVQAESEREALSAPPATPQRERKHPGRQILPAHLKRV
jgi:transposase